jgi:hypothetical protein
LGRGGAEQCRRFGQVFAVVSRECQAGAKFVPKTPSDDREVLFVRLDGLRKYFVRDRLRREHKDNCVIVMPRADVSLRDYLDAFETPSIEKTS